MIIDFLQLKNTDLTCAAAVVGADAFLVDRAIRQICSRITGIPEFDIAYLHSPSLSEITEACGSMPIGGLKVVIIHDYTDKGSTMDFLTAASGPFTAVFVSPEPKRFQDDLSDKFTAIRCGKLPDEAIAQYIQRECHIEYGAVKLLMEYCGRDMSRISNEVQKLSAYAEGRQVTSADVALLTIAVEEVKIFDITNKLAARDRAGTFKALNQLLMMERPSQIMVMIYNQFRRMLHCMVSKLSDAELAKALKVNESAIAINRRLAKNFNAVKLKKVNDYFHYYDRAVKTGIINETSALTVMTERIISL